MTRRLIATLVAVLSVMAPIQAANANHGAEFFNVPWLWNASSNFSVPMYFTTTFPTGTYRTRFVDGLSQWNALNGFLRWTNPPDIGPFTVFNGPDCPMPYQRNAFHWQGIDGQYGTLAALWFCYSSATGLMTNANVIVDMAEPWYLGTNHTPPAGQISPRAVSGHEMGHASGFAGHWDAAAGICTVGSGEPYHTMCPIYHPDQRTPATHDRTAFLARY